MIILISGNESHWKFESLNEPNWTNLIESQGTNLNEYSNLFNEPNLSESHPISLNEPQRISEPQWLNLSEHSNPAERIPTNIQIPLNRSQRVPSVRAATAAATVPPTRLSRTSPSVAPWLGTLFLVAQGAALLPSWTLDYVRLPHSTFLFFIFIFFLNVLFPSRFRVFLFFFFAFIFSFPSCFRLFFFIHFLFPFFFSSLFSLVSHFLLPFISF